MANSVIGWFKEGWSTSRAPQQQGVTLPPSQEAELVMASSPRRLGYEGPPRKEKPAAKGGFPFLGFGLVLLAAIGGLVVVTKSADRAKG
jgi:hypothetical protein